MQTLTQPKKPDFDISYWLLVQDANLMKKMADDAIAKYKDDRGLK